MLRCLAPEKPIPNVCVAINSPSALMEVIQKRGDHKESSMKNKLLPRAASCMEGPWGKESCRRTQNTQNYKLARSGAKGNKAQSCLSVTTTSRHCQLGIKNSRELAC